MPIDDAEDLKRLKIQPRASRLHLPTLGVPAPTDEQDVDEAIGGSGEEYGEPADVEALKARVVDTLKSIYDPEIPVNVYDLGLIYGIEIDPEKHHVEIEMTLTAPACPVAGMIVSDVARKVGDTEGVSTSHVKLTWDPPWSRDRMTEEAMLELGLL